MRSGAARRGAAEEWREARWGAGRLLLLASWLLLVLLLALLLLLLLLAAALLLLLLQLASGCWPGRCFAVPRGKAR